jgi:tetratricopeptide (TPR) repeat protein
MWGSRNELAHSPEEIKALLDEARAAVLRDDALEAAQLQETAVAWLRTMLAGSPADQRHLQNLGSVLYGLGASMIRIGRPEEAVPALDEALARYLSLDRSRYPVEEWATDVRIRRATAHATVGADASALIDVQTAVLAARATLPEDLMDDRYLRFARILAVGADVLASSADPDLAVDCADEAIRIYTAHGVGTDPRDGGRHVPYFLRAACVSAEIHRANDRPRLGRRGREVIEQFGGGAVIETVLLPRLNSAQRPDLTRPLGEVLERWAKLPSAGPLDDIEWLSALVVPGEGISKLVPADRVEADRRVATAERLATRLAELLLDRPDDALLLGIELHALFAAGATDDPGSLGTLPAEIAEPWAQVLRSCCAAAVDAGRPALALDLTGWLARAGRCVIDVT